MMLWIPPFFATPAKLLHLLVPSEYDSRKHFTCTKSSFYAKSDWLCVPRWYLSYPVCVMWKLRMAFAFLYISLLWHTWHACLDEDSPQELLKPLVKQLKISIFSHSSQVLHFQNSSAFTSTYGLEPYYTCKCSTMFKWYLCVSLFKKLTSYIYITELYSTKQIQRVCLSAIFFY